MSDEQMTCETVSENEAETAPPSSEITSNGRRADGCFAPGTTIGASTRFQTANTDALVIGTRSASWWRDRLPVLREWREAVLADLGYTETDVPKLLSLLIDSAVETRLKAGAYFEALAASDRGVGGPVTTRGRRARIAEHHRREVETFARLAGQIGLERRTRHVPTLADVMRGEQ